MNKSNDTVPRSQKTEKDRKQKKDHTRWVLTVLVLTLLLSFTFGFISEVVLDSAPLAVAYVVIVVLVSISILFDMIGTAAASCDIEPFLAMAARKVRGSKRAVKLVKNAEKVSSVCADIIGDICGILSGAGMATIVALQFSSLQEGSTTAILVNVLFSALLSTVTITGKAIGKRTAMDSANDIILAVAKVLSVFDKKEK